MKPLSLKPTELAVSLLYLLTLAPAGIDKIRQSSVPAWFESQFSSSPFNVFAGSMALQFYGIGAVEIILATLFALAIFLPSRRAALSVIRVGLLSSFALFIALGFGQRVTHQYEGAAFLFMYAAFTFLILKEFDGHGTASA